MILVDTNVWSEAFRPMPDPTVRAWARTNADQLWLSTVVAGEPTLLLDQGSEADPRVVFLVEGLGSPDLERLQNADLDRDAWAALLAVRPADAPEDAPPLLGRYEVADGAIRFTPRFPPEPGLRCRVTFDPARLPGQDRPPATGVITSDFVLARKAANAQRGGMTQRLVQLRVLDPDPLLFHAEVVHRDGVAVGYVRAASYGWTLGGAVGLAFVSNGEEPVTPAWLRMSMHSMRWPSRVSSRISTETSMPRLSFPSMRYFCR